MQQVVRYIQSLFGIILSLGRKLDRIESKLDQVLKLILRDEQIAVTLDLSIEVEGQITEGVVFMRMTDSQQAVGTIAPKNKRGGPAPVQPGSVLWTGPSFVAVTPSADGLSATFVAIGVGGDDPGGPQEAFGSVSADADLGEGVVTISSRFPIQVVASQATDLGVTFGEPTEQDAAGPQPNQP